MDNVDKMKGRSYPGTPARNSLNHFSLYFSHPWEEWTLNVMNLKKKTNLRLQIAQNVKFLLSLLLRSSFLNTKHIVWHHTRATASREAGRAAPGHHGSVWISPTLMSTVVEYSLPPPELMLEFHCIVSELGGRARGLLRALRGGHQCLS